MGASSDRDLDCARGSLTLARVPADTGAVRVAPRLGLIDWLAIFFALALLLRVVAVLL